MSALKSNIVDNLDEEYYQISPQILESFPKFRPPLNLFVFKEDVAQIQTLKKAGERMDKVFQEQLASLCAEGQVFVSRTDYPIYSKHISKQLDLVLVDKNLKEHEIAEIFKHALTGRISEFLEQPVKAVFDLLYQDLMVLTEYLWADLNRIKSLVRRIYREHDLTKHSFNTGALGLWLFEKMYPGAYNRRVYDKIALAMFLHDMGMSKIPPFIVNKPKPLTNDERQKVNMHPLVGSKIALKLGLKFDEMQQAIMEHHERLDGSGYPAKSTNPSPLGRVMAVTDSFCAMITKRPYAEAKSVEEAVRELVSMENKYDPKVVGHLNTSFASGGILCKICPLADCKDEK
jgi:HD-GYP domain-containing protein (c-di-GMP phosphodiesterase class II)